MCSSAPKHNYSFGGGKLQVEKKYRIMVTEILIPASQMSVRRGSLLGKR
jgi:hypothetical protein